MNKKNLFILNAFHYTFNSNKNLNHEISNMNIILIHKL